MPCLLQAAGTDIGFFSSLYGKRASLGIEACGGECHRQLKRLQTAATATSFAADAGKNAGKNAGKSAGKNQSDPPGTEEADPNYPRPVDGDDEECEWSALKVGNNMNHWKGTEEDIHRTYKNELKGIEIKYWWPGSTEVGECNNTTANGQGCWYRARLLNDPFCTEAKHCLHVASHDGETSYSYTCPQWIRDPFNKRCKLPNVNHWQGCPLKFRVLRIKGASGVGKPNDDAPATSEHFRSAINTPCSDVPKAIPEGDDNGKESADAGSSNEEVGKDANDAELSSEAGVAPQKPGKSPTAGAADSQKGEAAAPQDEEGSPDASQQESEDGKATAPNEEEGEASAESGEGEGKESNAIEGGAEGAGKTAGKTAGKKPMEEGKEEQQDDVTDEGHRKLLEALGDIKPPPACMKRCRKECGLSPPEEEENSKPGAEGESAKGKEDLDGNGAKKGMTLKESGTEDQGLQAGQEEGKDGELSLEKTGKIKDGKEPLGKEEAGKVEGDKENGKEEVGNIEEGKENSKEEEGKVEEGKVEEGKENVKEEEEGKAEEGKGELGKEEQGNNENVEANGKEADGKEADGKGKGKEKKGLAAGKVKANDPKVENCMDECTTQCKASYRVSRCLGPVADSPKNNFIFDIKTNSWYLCSPDLRCMRYDIKQVFYPPDGHCGKKKVCLESEGCFEHEVTSKKSVFHCVPQAKTFVVGSGDDEGAQAGMPLPLVLWACFGAQGSSDVAKHKRRSKRAYCEWSSFTGFL